MLSLGVRQGEYEDISEAVSWDGSQYANTAEKAA